MKTTSITNFGYLINKNEWSEDYLTIIKKDLTVKPFIDNKYCLLEEEPFPVFQEGTSRLLIPKYYGIEKIGMPQIINIDISDK